ncbi:MAG: transglutaminase domain-containing protein [Anaerolineae bacterium]|nr:transglutaminase domain-containing protein [Anaerolineae bacterium]
MTTELLPYYAQIGLMTDLKDQADRLKDVPLDVPSLCKVIQGLLLHTFLTHLYDVEVPEERKQELQIRSARRILARAIEIDNSPIVMARSPIKRVISNCRDFTTMTVALLRHQGIPARARCGFATYFEPGRYLDHWVCEVWNAEQNRWVMFDAQIDERQREFFHLDFDPSDMPPDKFLVGGEAWRRCRAGEADPNTFGILDMWGLWFVCGDLMRDFAALNKVELLPWDCWGLLDQSFDDLTEEEMALLDRAAALSTAGDTAFDEIRGTYENDDRLRVPPVITSWPGGVQTTITLANEV